MLSETELRILGLISGAEVPCSQENREIVHDFMQERNSHSKELLRHMQRHAQKDYQSLLGRCPRSSMRSKSEAQIDAEQFVWQILYDEIRIRSNQEREKRRRITFEQLNYLRSGLDMPPNVIVHSERRREFARNEIKKANGKYNFTGEVEVRTSGDYFSVLRTWLEPYILTLWALFEQEHCEGR